VRRAWSKLAGNLESEIGPVFALFVQATVEDYGDQIIA